MTFLVPKVRAVRAFVPVLFLAAATLFADGARAQDSLIVYGGLGHLSNKAQPRFGAIFEGRTPDGGALRRTIESQLRQRISGMGFPWSEAPVIIDHEDANAIMTQKATDRGENWDRVRPTITELAEEVDRLYLLAVVIDLEVHLESPPHVEGAEYATLLASSATALLVDFQTKEIVLSAGDVRSLLLTSTDGFLSEGQVTQGLARTYRNAAEASIVTLSERMRDRSPSDVFDRHMVTGGIYPGPNARRLFGLSPWLGQVKSVCELPDQCDGEAQCAQLTGLASSMVSAALTDAGQLVLPPARWTYWTERASNLVALNLAQPRGGLLEQALTFRLPLDAAEIKTIAEIQFTDPRLEKPDGAGSDLKVWKGTRYDIGKVKIYRYTTDSEDCAKGAAPLPVLEATGVHPSNITAGYTDPGVSVERLYALSAMIAAQDHLTKELAENAE